MKDDMVVLHCHEDLRHLGPVKSHVAGSSDVSDAALQECAGTVFRKNLVVFARISLKSAH